MRGACSPITVMRCPFHQMSHKKLLLVRGPDMTQPGTYAPPSCASCGSWLLRTDGIRYVLMQCYPKLDHSHCTISCHPPNRVNKYIYLPTPQEFQAKIPTKKIILIAISSTLLTNISKHHNTYHGAKNLTKV